MLCMYLYVSHWIGQMDSLLAAPYYISERHDGYTAMYLKLAPMATIIIFLVGTNVRLSGD